MSSATDTVARRKASALSVRVAELANRVAALEEGLLRLYGVVPPPPPTKKGEE